MDILKPYIIIFRGSITYRVKVYLIKNGILISFALLQGRISAGLASIAVIAGMKTTAGWDE